MCFNARYGINAALKRAMHDGRNEDADYWKALLEKYDATFAFENYYQVSGFAHPKIIVYENTKPFFPNPSIWGLVPDWAKNQESIWNSTLNARGETIFDKASFRKSAETKRCLIPVEGFYDFHHFRGKNYPFYITHKQGEVLYFAGLWNDWANKETGEIVNTFTIVTTGANTMMAKIHNKPKFSNDPRMPVMLTEDIRELWLKPLSKKEIQELAVFKIPDSILESWTVKKLSGKDSPGNVPEASSKYEYKELMFDDNEPGLF